MVLNLSKRFVFNREYDQYNVEYQFTKDKEGAAIEGNINLTLNVSLNREAIKTRILSKPTSVLYQSNEIIEKMIEEETLSFAGA